MRDNFKICGWFLALDSMKRELSTLLFSCLDIKLHDEMDMICVSCKGTFVSKRQEACKATLGFLLNGNHSLCSRNEIYVITANSAVD